MVRIIKDQCLLAIILLSIFIANAKCNELKMVHIIFRHGEKTPTDKSAREKYPNNPHLNNTFFPEGRGSLTNEGKLTMYTLGTFLRQRYNDFLGDLYYPGITRVRSTNKPRTMMSAQLVNAGLWPPAEAQRWKKDLLWMPIPYECVKSGIDILMHPYECPTYKAEYERVLRSDEMQKLIEPHLKFFAYVSEHSGANITRPQQIFFIDQMLRNEANCNLTIPSWAKGYFPDGEMHNVSLLEYDIISRGDLLKKISGGPLLRDILQDYKKLIEGTSSSKTSPKITLYSGHENNVVGVLNALGLWTSHIPDFGAAIIFELYSNSSTSKFGIQILYHRGKSGETIPLTLPGCTQICPVYEFTQLLSNVIPDDVEKLCGIEIRSVENQGSTVSLPTTLCITLQIWILIKMK